MAIDAAGWSEIVRAVGGAVKDIILALGVLWGAWASATNTGKLDVVGAKADVAAVEAKTAASRAAVVEKTTDAIAAINMSYEARRTGEADDMDRAAKAQAKVESVVEAKP